MAKKWFWNGMLVMVLAFGMAVVGCGDGNGTTNKGPTNNSDTGFILNNISAEHEGEYAILWAVENENYPIYGYQSVDIPTETITGIQIKNRKVNLPVWIATFRENALVSFSKYSGNDDIKYVGVFIINGATIKIGDAPNAGVVFESIKFTNGNATKSWDEDDEYP
jgi:hypothetical protein